MNSKNPFAPPEAPQQPNKHELKWFPNFKEDGIGRLGYLIALFAVFMSLTVFPVDGTSSIPGQLLAVSPVYVIVGMATFYRLRNLRASFWWWWVLLLPGANYLLMIACLLLPCDFGERNSVDHVP